MEIKLIRAGVNDAERLWKMQVEAFAEMYRKYCDDETSPAAEPLEKRLRGLISRFRITTLLWRRAPLPAR